MHVSSRRQLPAPTPYFLSQLIRGRRVGAIPLRHYLRNHIPSSPDTIATSPPRAATPPAQSPLLSGLPPTVLPSLPPPPAALLPWAPVARLQNREKAPPASRTAVSMGEGTRVCSQS